MLQYVHDYRLPADALEHIFSARRMLALDYTAGASNYVEEARCALEKYLAQDNVRADEKSKNGWVKMDDALQLTFTREQLECIRWYLGVKLKKFPDNQLALMHLGIINRCQKLLDCPCYDNVQDFVSYELGNWSKREYPI